MRFYGFGFDNTQIKETFFFPDRSLPIIGVSDSVVVLRWGQLFDNIDESWIENATANFRYCFIFDLSHALHFFLHLHASLLFRVNSISCDFYLSLFVDCSLNDILICGGLLKSFANKKWNNYSQHFSDKKIDNL